MPTPTPPSASQRPHVHEAHGDRRDDPYDWLRDRDDAAVLAHLAAENAYTDARLAHLERLRETLVAEYRARIVETDTSAPARKGEWWYYTRTVEGLAYRIHCRRKGGMDAPEQVLLDENALAEGHEFLAVGGLAISPDTRYLAYSFEHAGDEQFLVRVLDLETGEHLPDAIEGTSYGLEWSADGQHLLYTTLDAALRPYRLYRHRLGTAQTEDVRLWEEADPSFHLALTRTADEAFLVLHLHSMVSTEVHLLPRADVEGGLQLVEPRAPGLEYGVEHHEGRLLILANDAGPNFRLVSAPVDAPGKDSWTELVAHDPERRIETFRPFRRHVALLDRGAAATRLRILRLADADVQVVAEDEPVHTIALGVNLEFDTDVVRYSYASLTTPRSAIDYDMQRRERTVVKQDPVRGYDPSRYVSERLWATAEDGVQVPISVVRRADVPVDGSAPCLLYGYGAYEVSVDPAFSPTRVSLLERGVIYAIAHVRGGGELGRRWYEDGKLAAKEHTFSDTVTCAEHLLASGYAAKGRLALRGASAGGLLVGAVLNLRPELFAAAVAQVPFVDMLSTMLDPSMPLTVIEWEEWGNPVASVEDYRRMRGYSPFDNLRRADYPRLLVTAGLNDPRVGYHEPAKWVARLRELNDGAPQVLLKTDLGAGHMGASGRYGAWNDEALVQAFVLDALGCPVGAA